MVVGPVAFRGFATSPVVIPSYAGNPKCRNPELFQILEHASLRSTAMTVSRIHISRFRNARVSCPRNPRYVDSRWGQPPMVLDGCHLSLRWTALIVSGNRVSRFHCARVSRLWKLRYAEPRLSGISRHASSPMDGSKLPSGYRGSRILNA
jgi:hypothetical protein